MFDQFCVFVWNSYVSEQKLLNLGGNLFYMDEKRLEIELSTNSEKYSEHYSEDRFLKKVSRLTKKKSLDGVIKAFILYYTISAPTTPKWVVINIIPCLGYFILPIDLVPDFLVGVGFIDDIAAFGITLKMMSGPIRDMLRDFATPDILIKTLKSTKALFKNVPEEEIRRIINNFELYEPI